MPIFSKFIIAEKLLEGGYSPKPPSPFLKVSQNNINTAYDLYLQTIQQYPSWNIPFEFISVSYNKDGSEDYADFSGGIDTLKVVNGYYYKFVIYALHPVQQEDSNFQSASNTQGGSNIQQEVYPTEEFNGELDEGDDDGFNEQHALNNSRRTMPKQIDQSFLNLSHNTTSTSFNMSEQLDEGEESVVEEDTNAHFQNLAPMTRHALGRDAKIGAQYNGHLDQFCKGNIFSSITTSDVNETYPPKCADVNIIEQNLFDVKAKIMHVENELQVSMLSDTITPPNQVKIKTISQEFLMSKFTNKHQVEVILTFSECLQKTELKDLARMANRIELRFISQQATHIVAGYEWGIFLALKLIIPVPNNENEKMVLQKIKPYLAMIKEYVINQQDRVILMDQIKHERFHTQLYTTKIEEYELTLGEIIDLVRAEIKQMKEANKRRGFKIRYTLWPISLLTDISDKIRLNELPLVPTSSSTLEMLIQQRDQLETRFAQLQEICDYMQNYANFINDKVLYDVRNTKSHCEKINTNLQNKYRDFITFSRHGDYKGGDLRVDIEADYNYLVQQLDVFLSGDQESFFNKINYIDYLTQGRKVPYLGKNMNLDEFIRPIKDGYVFFCCWDEVDINEGNEKDDGELFHFDKLLNDQKTCLFVDQDLMLNPIFPSQCRICQIKNGQIFVEDLLNRYIPRTNICLAKPEKNRFVEYMSKPDKAVQFEICCPRSSNEFGDLKCRNTPHFWYCNECYQCFWYFDTYLYCACGKARVLTFEFRCNDPPHGQAYIKYNQETLRKITSQIQPMRDIHILVLGCTGVGKSTWMNGIANYLTFSTFQEARKSDNVTLIPTEFKIFTRANNRTVEQTISVGESENEKISTGASATQFPKAHVFTTRNLRIHLIDTPGIGDTRGPAQDVENFGTIIRYLENYEELHGICILLKPNESRLNLMFKYCVNELLAHLHKDAAKNIMFCFTNAKGTNYKPGDTLTVLKGYLEESLREDKRMDGVKIIMNDENVYCLDNESIRILYAEHSGVQFDQDEIDGCTKSWNTSQKTTARLVAHVQTLPPHKMRDMISVNDSRRIINVLSGPLANLSNLIALNMAKIDNKKEELRRLDCNSGMENIRNQLFTTHYYLETEELAKPRTVCASPNCTYKPDFGTNTEVQEEIYTQICCDSCPLSVTPVNQKNVPQLKKCEAFKHEDGEFKEMCKKCGCDYSMHMHITYHQKIGLKVVRSDIQARSAKEAIDEYLKECEKTKLELMGEQNVITEACRKFGDFLKTYAIMANNDAYREYLDKEIQAEKRFSPDARNHKKLLELERMLEEFKEQERILLKTGSTTSNAVIEPKDIQETLCTLFGLQHMGKMIQKIHDEANDAQAQHFAFIENKVDRPNIDALALEEAKINADLADTTFGQLALAPDEVDRNKVEIKKAPKQKKNEGSLFPFSWIRGRMGHVVEHVVEQVGAFFGFNRPAKQMVNYIQDEPKHSPPQVMRERKPSMDQISNYSACTTSSTISNPNNTMDNPTLVNNRQYYQAQQNAQPYYDAVFGEQQQQQVEKHYVPPYLKRPNMDAVANQMKGLHLQQLTSNSQNLPTMNTSPNPMPENTPINRPANLHYNPNPYHPHQQHTPNYPNLTPNNAFGLRATPHMPPSPNNFDQHPAQFRAFNQNAGQGNNYQNRHFPRNQQPPRN